MELFEESTIGLANDEYQTNIENQKGINKDTHQISKAVHIGDGNPIIFKSLQKLVDPDTPEVTRNRNVTNNQNSVAEKEYNGDSDRNLEPHPNETGTESERTDNSNLKKQLCVKLTRLKVSDKDIFRLVNAKKSVDKTTKLKQLVVKLARLDVNNASRRKLRKFRRVEKYVDGVKITCESEDAEDFYNDDDDNEPSFENGDSDEEEAELYEEHGEKSESYAYQAKQTRSHRNQGKEALTNKHTSNAGGDDRLYCTQCHYKTKKETKLEHHILLHKTNKLKWFYCTYCKYKSYYKCGLQTHQHVHRENERIPCKFCNKTFKATRGLQIHMFYSHRNEANTKELKLNLHKCSKCSYETHHKYNLRFHMVKHTKVFDGLKRYQCDRCDYSTYYPSAFHKHKWTHTNTNPYVCSKCGKGFKGKTVLDNHIMKNHANDVVLMATVTSKIHKCVDCSYKSVYISAINGHRKARHNSYK